MTFDRLRIAQDSHPPSDAADLPASECREMLASLWDYRDGNCCPELAERVRAHLAWCVPCFLVGQSQDHFFASLAELREWWRPPSRVRDRVREALGGID